MRGAKPRRHRVDGTKPPLCRADRAAELRQVDVGQRVLRHHRPDRRDRPRMRLDRHDARRLHRRREEQRVVPRIGPGIDDAHPARQPIRQHLQLVLLEKEPAHLLPLDHRVDAGIRQLQPPPSVAHLHENRLTLQPRDQPRPVRVRHRRHRVFEERQALRRLVGAAPRPQVDEVVPVPSRSVVHAFERAKRFRRPHEVAPPDPPGKRRMKQSRQVLRSKPRDPLQPSGINEFRTAPDGIVDPERRRGREEDVRSHVRLGLDHEQPVFAVVQSVFGGMFDIASRRFAGLSFAPRTGARPLPDLRKVSHPKGLRRVDRLRDPARRTAYITCDYPLTSHGGEGVTLCVTDGSTSA